jgi:hypothetical protein
MSRKEYLAGPQSPSFLMIVLPPPYEYSVSRSLKLGISPWVPLAHRTHRFHAHVPLMIRQKRQDASDLSSMSNQVELSSQRAQQDGLGGHRI